MHRSAFPVPDGDAASHLRGRREITGSRRLASGDHAAAPRGALARRSLLVVVGAALALAGCQPGGGGGSVENAALGIIISPLPAPFEVADNSGPNLRLTVEGDATRGEVEFHLGPPEPRGINLVEESTRRKAYFESRPGGAFSGNQEIVAPIGHVYTARGQYDSGGQRVEELWALSVPPGTDRLLSIVYRYPAGDDSPQRAQHLLALLENLAASKTS